MSNPRNDRMSNREFDLTWLEIQDDFMIMIQWYTNYHDDKKYRNKKTVLEK